MRFLISTVTVLLAIIFPIEGGNEDLLATAVIFRHGDRTPSQSYKNDLYPGYFPEGYGQLNNRGKKRQYNLGKWFRERYTDFLSEMYNSKDVFVRSSDVDRTIMSAQTALAGLFPPKSYQVWDRDIPWQPIPVHTIPILEDNIIFQLGIDCPKYAKLRDELKHLSEFKQLHDENQELFKYLSEHSGNNITTLTDVMLLHDTLLVEQQYDLPLPDWATGLMPQMAHLSAIYLGQFTWTKEMQKFAAGRILYDILQRFIDIAENKKESQKFVIYSGHDTTVLNILRTIGTYSDLIPYSTTLLFELRKNNSGHEVNVYLKIDDFLQEINVNECEHSCELNNFEAALKDIALSEEQWKNACQV